MLTLHYVNPTGMFSYGLSDNISLEDHKVVHLCGVNHDDGQASNGSGKSSLFNSICEILWGKNLTGASGSSVINTVYNKGFAGQVEFTSWEKKRYRVTYCMKWKTKKPYNSSLYKGSSLFFEVYENNELVDLRGASKAETREKILYALGVSFDSFTAMSYFSSRHGTAMLRGSNKEKMEVISGICGLEEWDRIMENSRAKKKNEKHEVESLTKQRLYLQGIVDTQTNQLQYLDYYKEQIKNAKNAEKECKEEIKELEKQLKELNKRNAVLQSEQQKSYDRNAYEQFQQQKQNLTNQLHQLQTPIYENECSEERILSESINTLTNEVHVLQGNLQASSSIGLFEVGHICPTCETKITKAKAEKLNEKINKLQDKITCCKAKREEQLQELNKRKSQRQNNYQASQQEYIQQKHNLLEQQKIIEKQQNELLVKTQKYNQLIQETKYIQNNTENQIKSKKDSLVSSKERLNQLGYDLIKKNPSKDGHLTSAPYYLRDRKFRFCFMDSYYAIRALHDEYNKHGEVTLAKYDFDEI